MNMAVSRAIPKEPSASCASTSSDVFPARASSTSWITPAPFIATPAKSPSDSPCNRRGDSPTLMKWAPIPSRTGAFRRRARTTASTTARKSFAAR